MISDTKELEQRLYQNETAYFREKGLMLYGRINLDQNNVECYHLLGKDKSDECRTMEYVVKDIFHRICMEESRLRFLNTFVTQHFYKLHQQHIGWITQELKLRCDDGKLCWVELNARILKEPETSCLFVFLYGTDIDIRKKLELSCQISIKKEDLFYTEIGIEALMDTILWEKRKTREPVAMILVDIAEIWGKDDERSRYLQYEADYLLYQKLKDFMVFSRLKNGRLMMLEYRQMKKSEFKTAFKEIRRLIHDTFDHYLYPEYHADFTTSVVYLDEENKLFSKNMRKVAKLLEKGCMNGTDQDHLLEKDIAPNTYNCLGKGLKDSMCIMDEIDELMFLIDVHTNKILYVNRAVENKLETDRSQILQHKCYEVIHGFSSPCYSCKNHMPVSDQFRMWKCTSNQLKDTYFIKDRMMMWKGREVRFEIFYEIHQFPNALIPKETETMKTAVEILVENRDCENVLRTLLMELCRFYGAESAGIYLHKQGYLSKNELLYPQERTTEPVTQGQGIYGVHYALKDGDDIIGQLELYGSMAVNNNMDIIRFYTYVCNVQLLRNHAVLMEAYMKSHDVRSKARSLINLYEYIDALKVETISSAGVICIGLLHSEMISSKEINAHMSALVKSLSGIYKDHEIYQLRGDRLLILLLEYSRKEFDLQFQKLNKLLDETCISEYYFRNSQIDIMDMMTQVMLLTDSAGRRYQSEGQGHLIMYQKMSDELKQDIESGNYKIYLQPKADLNGEIKGAEALIRCLKEDRVISPASFVDRFEALDLIGEIDLFVFEEVCRLQQEWESKGIHLPVSFNFSRMTLIDKHLFEKLEAIRSRYKVAKKSLEIEITETVGSISAEIIDDIANQFAEKGYQLSLDDFGARYSNLSILAEVDFHTLKLDKDIVDDIHMNPKVRNIVRSVIQVCHDMKIQVVAEGVESLEQMEILKHLHCDLVQGYYINKPIPVPAFEKQYLKKML